MTRTLLPWTMVLALAACDNLGLGGAPNELDVQLEAQGVSQVQMITSTQWISQPDPACEAQDQTCEMVVRILDADTTTVQVPYKRTLGFTDTYQYAVIVYPAGGVTATVAMRVEIDGKEWFNETRELTPTGDDGEQATLQFVYQWQEPRIR